LKTPGILVWTKSIFKMELLKQLCHNNLVNFHASSPLTQIQNIL